MSIILCIETGTEVCSVSLSKDSKIIDIRESAEPQAHARQLAVFIDELLKKNSLTTKDLSAVAVSEGPGSYTGLRIGVSTAKGICFGSGIPMIAIDSLQALTQGAINQVGGNTGSIFCPMIDARRMEVYTALYHSDGSPKTATEALIIDENSFQKELAESKVYFFGNGAPKCIEIINHPNAAFINVTHTAANMVHLAHRLFDAAKFVDVAYFEPFYLKDFVVTKSKKNSLGL
ncbi:tRNA (adenosine(37)-N6)-threonylcarbamoyltransferase complex dimerization subunit type 1 TsaB [Acetobacteroides hydrogenigenes]|uniref:tRNA threonylcarbamoyladenosine biosynthesis protein TsaB n=1 Tax=Acetobacteroides hydrogenigenes TaxID=979970 RepID=A0A4R2EQQ7_9BACT|nr:tRNA (adenosine(37)-N6)-threonylcarbamoyltransferase complex dimerization subunit type 1 TsaB [Acetobacteroides hydrogenigenes]TCN68964.1 tRNA threonylcarbamoyladenosine biosynthesis protein TsaB [Acetobacteroides hydrogenigenes]